MTLIARIGAPTPWFFRRVRRMGLFMAGIGGAIIAAPVALPLLVITAGGYLAVAGTVAVAISQAATLSDAGEHE